MYYHVYACFYERRYVYKYVNDLETILGYTSAQIHKMMGIKPLNDDSESNKTKTTSSKGAQNKTIQNEISHPVYADDQLGKFLKMFHSKTK